MNIGYFHCSPDRARHVWLSAPARIYATWLAMTALTLSSVPVAIAAPTYTKVSAGADHACALVDNGAVHCWGANLLGQLGNGTTTNSLFASPVSGITDAVDISAGNSFTCAVRSDGTVWCWGNGESLGRGSTVDSAVPVQATGISNASAIATGNSHACAKVTLLTTAVLYCWGNNAAGQLGLGDNVDRLTPQPLGLAGVGSFSLGISHTCARMTADSSVRCWGLNSSGQLGNNSLINSNLPVTVNLVTTATAVAAGGNQSCARLADSSLRCWGSNNFGQLGDASSTDRQQPVPVVGISTATSVSVGQFSTCAALADGTLRCWGNNANSALGTGSALPHVSPVPLTVLKISNATQVSAGTGFACARLNTGSVRCWGFSGTGQTGSGLGGIVTSQRMVSSTCSLDIDGDDSVNATTDGVLLSRAALGMSGSAIVTGTTTSEAGRPDWPSIRAFLTTLCGMTGLAP